MMDTSKRLGFYWIRALRGLRWEPAELVNRGGYLEAMVLGYDMGVPIDKIYEWDVEILPLPYEEFGEEKD